jgi:hypothetical protein
MKISIMMKPDNSEKPNEGHILLEPENNQEMAELQTFTECAPSHGSDGIIIERKLSPQKKWLYYDVSFKK